MIQLIYVADPMCSWCYGFGPELQALLEMMPDANLDIIVGGLRAYNQEVMSEATTNHTRSLDACGGSHRSAVCGDRDDASWF
jgi:protein-disulfide isomerase-like protein with CxxC motif